MDVQIEASWKDALKEEFEKDYFIKLTEFVRNEYRQHTCYPPGNEIFNAFNLCPLSKVKVVILGQDPYHGEGQAEGLCFSVKTGIALPPSLINIFKEVKDDIGTRPQIIKDLQGKDMYDGSLRRWAQQGVFLLNTCLSVRQHEAFSHSRQGWESFTDAVIKIISEKQEHVAFMLWGGPARSKKKIIDTSKHLVLESVHPSPLSANRGGWFGNHHFSRCNAWLQEKGLTPIVW
ncbi:MAG: uracil-DNA glycosylase [Prevotella sp.]|jgi:uracil-DNA glycosylase|nr:uracil-DNA glycosylase [Prevotella sp.]MBR4379565.1 uracil-DNA glycosylase [Prevotella sp.]